MLSATAVASYFIGRSSELAENDLTNLKLQKILFYAQAEALAADNSPLFKDNIEAWKYGPVVPMVYDWLRGCGAYPITTFDISVDEAKTIPDDQQPTLDRVWNTYNKYSAGYLVDRTHESGSPWALVYSDNKNNLIPNDTIKKAKLQAQW